MNDIGYIGYMPKIRLGTPRGWLFYLIDIFVAIAGPLLITAFIAYSHLYPHISSITMLYLLLIIGLAVLRSRYPAMLAIVVSLLAIDFFLIEPLLSFSIGHSGELFSLALFLVVAVLTSFLAGLARRQAYEATERENRLRILYELLRVCALTDDVSEQLDSIALATNRVFFDWGVKECAICLPDEKGELQLRANAPIDIDEFRLSTRAHQAGQMVLRTGAQSMISDADDNTRQSMVYMIPLRTASLPFGVLYLRVMDGSPWLANEKNMQQELSQNSLEATFFWSYIDQIGVLIDRALLHQRLVAN
jgi:Osmosensitive K+ channel histidine kinase